MNDSLLIVLSSDSEPGMRVGEDYQAMIPAFVIGKLNRSSLLNDIANLQ